MLDAAGDHGSVAVVIDMTASGAQLLLAVAARRESSSGVRDGPADAAGC